MIYSPTRADMIEANHPNACNLCHTQQPINWMLHYLQEWYGKRYDEDKISASYPDRARAVCRGWLVSDNPSVRLVAVEALIRTGDRSALPQLVDALDDPYLVNREFACKGLQDMLGLRLGDFGYRVSLSRTQRRQSLAALRARIGTSQRGAPGGGEAARPRDKSAAPGGDADLLKGEWAAVEGMRDGKALSKEELARIRIIFTEDRLFGRRVDLGPLLPAQQADNLKTCSYTLSSGKTPKQIGLGVQTGAKGLSFPGIYELHEDTLRLCLNLERTLAKPPTKFASPKGAGLTLLTLKKVKK
jgi:uncharacterized protein (TIGR03067 family)